MSMHPDQFVHTLNELITDVETQVVLSYCHPVMPLSVTKMITESNQRNDLKRTLGQLKAARASYMSAQEVTA